MSIFANHFSFTAICLKRWYPPYLIIFLKRWTFLNAAIEELSVLKEEPSGNVLSRVSWQKEEVIREPYVGSFRNLLLNHPGTQLQLFLHVTYYLKISVHPKYMDILHIAINYIFGFFHPDVVILNLMYCSMRISWWRWGSYFYLWQ